MELNGVADASLVEVGRSLTACIEELLCRRLRIFALDSLKGVGMANRTTGEKPEYFSKLECWFGLFSIAFECPCESSAIPPLVKLILSLSAQLWQF